MKTEKTDFQYGQLPASPKFLRLYKHLSNAETCYLNWIITHRDRSKPGLRTLPIADTTVAEKLEYSFLTIRDARLKLAKQGIITTIHHRAQTYICEIPSYWYRSDVVSKEDRKCSDDDYTNVVKSATKPKSSSLRNTNAESGTNTHQERLPSAAPTLPTDAFTAVLTASSSYPSSDVKSKFQPVLDVWYEYTGSRRKKDESKINDVLCTIMDRFENDDVAMAVDILTLAITDYLPRLGTNRLRYLTGITETPQGIQALDEAFRELSSNRMAGSERLEKQTAIQNYPPMRRCPQAKSDTNHSTVGPEKYQELLSKLSKDFKMNNHD